MKTFKAYLILAIFLIGTVLVSAQTPISSGPVSGTWNLTGSPYMVNGEIYIDDAETLIIEPGVEVRFTGWYKLIVYGSILAEGTETDPILFTADDTNFRWFGIRFIFSAGTSVLNHCIVEYGLTKLDGGFGNHDYYGGGILLYNSHSASILIKNSIIRENIADIGGGIQIYGTYPVIENCEIIANTAHVGGGIDAMFMSSSSAVTVINSLIAYNHAHCSGGGISVGPHCNLELLNNSIIHNTTSNNGAGLRVHNPKTLVVKGNIIAHNSCTNKGGGIRFADSDTVGTFSDNTIAYNYAENGGSGIYLKENCAPSFESDILYFNSPDQVCLESSSIFPFFKYCDAQDGYAGFSGPGASSFPYSTNFLNCIDADPLFVDATNNDFNLRWNNYPDPDNTRSPCIDTGCETEPEPDGTCNDIGAYFFFQQIDIPEVLPPESVSQTSFIAKWEEAFGALYYLLDVAEDNAFTTFILQDDSVTGRERLLEGLEFGKDYYYRVRAANTAVTSEYSAIMGNPVNISAYHLGKPEIFFSNGTIKIMIKDKSNESGELFVYNMVGKLLVRQSLVPGFNVINPGVSSQVVILRVVIDNRMYHRKLYVH